MADVCADKPDRSRLRVGVVCRRHHAAAVDAPLATRAAMDPFGGESPFAFGCGRLAIGSCSLEEFVGRIELRDHDIDDLHCADGSMPNAGRDHDAHARPERNQLIVQLHLRVLATLQNEIRFRQLLVVVSLRVLGDFRDVNRRRVVLNVCESPLC